MHPSLSFPLLPCTPFRHFSHILFLRLRKYLGRWDEKIIIVIIVRETGSLPWDYVSYMILMISPKNKMGALAKIWTKIAQIDLLNGGEGSEYKIKDWRKLRDVKRKTFYFFLDFYSIWENGPFIFPRKILVYYVFYC